MNLDNLSSGSKLFIDTNIFLYAIMEHPVYGKTSKNLLENIEIGIVQGYTSVIVMNELLHKLIIGEIADKFGLKLFQVSPFIKKDVSVLTGLKSYELLDKIECIHNFEILSLTKEIFRLSRSYMTKYHLMTNDAVIAATCNKNGISYLATNDCDFDHVDFLKLWSPR